VKFLIDECLHTTLVAVAQTHGHECFHVNWLGLSGETDWNLMPRIIQESFTFVTNNARDFRKLYAREEVHAGLILIVPQVLPALQRELFEVALDNLPTDCDLLNEIIEVTIDDGAARITRYTLPDINT
jgi:predicted nuclease of predicted toxin-antitoxin system